MVDGRQGRECASGLIKTKADKLAPPYLPRPKSGLPDFGT
jgi:hypothetical protein